MSKSVGEKFVCCVLFVTLVGAAIAVLYGFAMLPGG